MEHSFGVAIWRLWFWRNNYLFNHGAWDNVAIFNDIKTKSEEIHHTVTMPLLMGNRRVEKWIGWTPPTWP